jgi:hypothetical protein
MNTNFLAFNLQTSLQHNQPVNALMADHLRFRYELTELGIYDPEAEAQALMDIALEPVTAAASLRHLPVAC